MLNSISNGMSDKTRPEQINRQEMKNGFLVIEVLENNGSPISLATVMIYSEVQNELMMLKVLQTGINGKTEPVCFKIADEKTFVCEGMPTALPANYSIRVEYSGYHTNIYRNAKVYADVLAVQTCFLVPLAFGTKNVPGQEKMFEASVKPLTKF